MDRISADDLYPVLEQIDYPVTPDELSAKAQEVGDKRAMDFFESIPQQTQFDSKEEILNMAEQIDQGETGANETMLDEGDEIY